MTPLIWLFRENDVAKVWRRFLMLYPKNISILSQCGCDYSLLIVIVIVNGYP